MAFGDLPELAAVHVHQLVLVRAAAVQREHDGIERIFRVTSGRAATGFDLDLGGSRQNSSCLTHAFDRGVSGLNVDQINNFAVACALDDPAPATAPPTIPGLQITAD